MSKAILRGDKVIVTGRLIFDRYLFEADPKKGKQKAALLIPEDTDLTVLQEMCQEVAEAKWPKGLPKGIKWPVKATDPAGYEEHPHMEGMKILNAGTSLDGVVGIIGIDNRPIGREDIKAGDDVMMAVDAWCYDVDGNKGVALNLWGVKKLADNEPFGSKRSTASLFGVEEPTDDTADMFEGASF